MVLGRFARPGDTSKNAVTSSAASTTSTANEDLLHPESQNASAQDPPTQFEQGDWSSILPDTEHVRFFRSVDWGKSSLGPLESWGSGLRVHTATCLADSRPGAIYWYESQQTDDAIVQNSMTNYILQGPRAHRYLQ